MTQKNLSSARTWLTVAAALVLAGCAYRGPSQTSFGPRLSWFSYVAADDIRAACVAPALDTIRLAYNGDFEQQVRGYDVVFNDDGSAALTARARGRRGDLTRLSVAGPWAVAVDQANLAPPQAAGLRAALAGDGAFTRSSSGLRLASDEYYWLVASCLDGTYHYAAYLHPRQDHAGLRFPAAILGLDPTGVPFQAARPVERRDDLFQLQVNRAGDGLVGPRLAF